VLIWESSAEAARDYFEASWRYLRGLRTQLPGEHQMINLNEEFMAKVGHMKAGLKPVSYLGVTVD
jgi:hypothetical protein